MENPRESVLSAQSAVNPFLSRIVTQTIGNKKRHPKIGVAYWKQRHKVSSFDQARRDHLGSLLDKAMSASSGRPPDANEVHGFGFQFSTYC